MTIAPTLDNRLCLAVDEVAVVPGCSRRQVYRLLESDESFPWITFRGAGGFQSRDYEHGLPGHLARVHATNQQ